MIHQIVSLNVLDRSFVFAMPRMPRVAVTRVENGSRNFLRNIIADEHDEST